MANKKTNSRTSSAKRAAETRRLNEEKKRNKNQMGAIWLFALGVFLLALAIVEGSSLWAMLHTFLRAMCSYCSYVIGPLLMIMAVLQSMEKNEMRAKLKNICLVFLFFFVCGAFQIFSTAHVGSTFVDAIADLYNNGTELTGGGVCGFLGVLLLKWCGKTGAIILDFLMIFVFLMLSTGGTIIGLIREAQKPVKKMEEAYVAVKESIPAPKARFDVDVPLDGEPARSSKNKIDRENAGKVSAEAQAAQNDLFNAIGGKKVAKAEPVNKAYDYDSQPDHDYANKDTGKDDNLENLITRAVSGTSTVAVNHETADGKLIFGSEKTTEKPAEEEETPDLLQPGEKHPYKYPKLSLLNPAPKAKTGDAAKELKDNANLLVKTLQSFGISTKVTDVVRGPTVTRYELQPSAGVKIARITSLADDIALNLAATGVRIEAPIPGKAAVGIEVPNKEIESVPIREVLASDAFNSAKSPLAVALGKDVGGTPVIADLAKMPHLLIAGSTGSGKSVCINCLITSLLFKSSPEELKLIMIDPKKVELSGYNGLPHLVVPVVTEPRKACGALGSAVTEMLRRYQVFENEGVRDLHSYNETAKNRDDLETMPSMIIIIDELADLMMSAPKDVEDHICRIAQMGRAAGIHLVIATQRPSVNVITGLIKANVPSRISFAVSSAVDSRIILDEVGAEKLIGRGDMLYYPLGIPKPVRAQCSYVADDEVERVIGYIKKNNAAEYSEAFQEEIEKNASLVRDKNSTSASSNEGDADSDELYLQAVETVIDAGTASTSMLQRRLRVGYARAARLIDMMEENGVVGPADGSKGRQVLLSRDQFLEMKLNKSN